jgi:hypothetical protein
MATTTMNLRSLASAGALVLITACSPATAEPPGPDDGTEVAEDAPGDTYEPDCRTGGSEMLPC